MRYKNIVIIQGMQVCATRLCHLDRSHHSPLQGSPPLTMNLLLRSSKRVQEVWILSLQLDKSSASPAIKMNTGRAILAAIFLSNLIIRQRLPPLSYVVVIYIADRVSSQCTSNIANRRGFWWLLPRDTDVDSSLLICQSSRGNMAGFSVYKCL
jgi:hypothetical protein